MHKKAAADAAGQPSGLAPERDLAAVNEPGPVGGGALLPLGGRHRRLDLKGNSNDDVEMNCLLMPVKYPSPIPSYRRVPSPAASRLRNGPRGKRTIIFKLKNETAFHRV